MRGHLLAAAALAAAFTAFAQPAAAQQYPTYHDQHVANQQSCQRARNGNTAAGAALGGIVGAVLGSQVAARGHRTDGSVLGAVVGATAGGAIGRANTRCYGTPQGSYDPYSGQARDPYSQDPYYRGDNDDLYGGPRQSGYYGDRRDCRMGEQILRDPYGREYREDIWMCRGSDGVWRPER
jgi:hypothetical protein